MSIYRIFICAAAVVIALLGPLSAGGTAEDRVDMTCLNIGKADCVILRAGGRAFLIDTGYAQTYPALEAALDEMGIAALDGVFLTHCHTDHQGGIMPLALSSLPVGNWYASGIYYNTDTQDHPILRAAEARGTQAVFLSSGDRIDVSDGIWFDVLGPLTVDTENENNNSLVMRFVSPCGSILLTGDMKLEEEASLIGAGLLQASDVLKCGHHGDNKATGDDLLSIVRPRVALISTSTPEEPDTPAKSTLKRLSGMGCAVYVTQDAQDAWRVVMDAQGVRVEDVAWRNIPAKVKDIVMTIETEDDVLSLLNTGGEAVRLNGTALYSTRGNELFYPADMVLEPGVPYLIGSGKTKEHRCDQVLNDKRIWHKSKLDIAVLYDAWGRPIAACGNGMED